MMKQPPRQIPIKDERDEQIDTQAKVHILDGVITATQILTVMCLIKRKAISSSWRGFSSYRNWIAGMVWNYGITTRFCVERHHCWHSRLIGVYTVYKPEVDETAN